MCVASSTFHNWLTFDSGSLKKKKKKKGYCIWQHIRRTPISAGQIKKKKKNANIKCDEINIMNIINDNTFNLHNSLLNNDNRYMKVTLNFKLIGVAR